MFNELITYKLSYNEDKLTYQFNEVDNHDYSYTKKVIECKAFSIKNARIASVVLLNADGERISRYGKYMGFIFIQVNDEKDIEIMEKI